MTPGQSKEVLSLMAAAAKKNASSTCRLRDWRSRMSLHVQTRLLAAPTTGASYDKEARTAVATLSRGNIVRRPYGREALKISKDAVILTRIKTGGVPLLDSHNQTSVLDHALGRITAAWIEDGALLGELAFHDTERGRQAEGMVARGELGGVSIGYRVEEWEIKDQDGNVIDPERDRVPFDADLTFVGTRWELLEASLVTVPADASASIRSSEFDMACFESAGIGAAEAARMRMRLRQRAADQRAAAGAIGRMQARQNTLARMLARQAMHDRQQVFDRYA